jgi:hypothetical protein
VLAELLRSAGPREDAPSERARRVELAVRAEWQAVVRHKHLRTRARWFAASGLATAAAVTLFVQATQWPAGGYLASTAQAGAASTFVAVHDVAPPSAEFPAEDVVPGFSRARMASRPRRGASTSAPADSDRAPDGGLPRRILVNYTWESR